MWSALTADPPGAIGSGRDIAELNAWARRAWWAGRRSPRQKARGCLELALTPWQSLREAAHAFGEYSRFVSRQFGIPRHRQLARLVTARVRHGLDPIAFYRLQLFSPDRWSRAGWYVLSRDTGLILRWLVAETPGYPRVFGDKRVFEAWCTRHALPAVPTLVSFDGGRVIGGAMPDGSLPPVDLVSKPANWQGGHGVVGWMYRDGWYVGSEGGELDAPALVAELARRSAAIGRPILLQRMLRNARSEAGLTSGGLCTVRLTTIRHPGRDPELLFALYRMPAGGSVADNFASGGLASPVDLATGRLGRAIRKEARVMPAPADRHPDTGVPIEGHVLGQWPAAVNLALGAHAAIDWKGVPVIGWDVALLENGPVLLEGNNIPCITGSQMILGAPLGDTALVACVNAHLRERFASSQ